MIGFPTVRLDAGLGRGAVNIIGAGFGLALGASHVAPNMPAAVLDFDLGYGVNGTTLTIAASALVGALIANALLSRFAA